MGLSLGRRRSAHGSCEHRRRCDMEAAQLEAPTRSRWQRFSIPWTPTCRGKLVLAARALNQKSACNSPYPVDEMRSIRCQ